MLIFKYVGFDKVKLLCGFTKYTGYELKAMPQST